MLELRKTDNTKAAYRRVKLLYLAAFPADERAPFRLLRRRAAQGRADCWDLMHQGDWVGFAYAVFNEALAYVFFLAICPDCRGKGYGTEAIRRLKEQYASGKLFLALEDWREPCENPEERIQRHSFYLRCGLLDLPYRLKEATMTYAMMGTGGPVEPEEYRILIDGYRGPLLKHLIEMRIVKEELPGRN